MSSAALGLYDFMSIMQIQSAPLLEQIRLHKGGNIPWHYETVHTIPGENMNRYEMIEEIKVAHVVMEEMSECISDHDISEPTKGLVYLEKVFLLIKYEKIKFT